ncbi:MAG: hypothetical protein EOO17_01060 [Chloroflexi bacterium]|nr:MAG: hypothetical protein EOO17_01060 [Chloroflexota bacterium]
MIPKNFVKEFKKIVDEYERKRLGKIQNHPSELYGKMSSDDRRVAAAWYLVQTIGIQYEDLPNTIRGSLDFFADKPLAGSKKEDLGCRVRGIPGYVRLQRLSLVS